MTFNKVKWQALGVMLFIASAGECSVSFDKPVFEARNTSNNSWQVPVSDLNGYWLMQPDPYEDDMITTDGTELELRSYDPRINPARLILRFDHWDCRRGDRYCKVSEYKQYLRSMGERRSRLWTHDPLSIVAASDAAVKLLSGSTISVCVWRSGGAMTTKERQLGDCINVKLAPVVEKCTPSVTPDNVTLDLGTQRNEALRSGVEQRIIVQLMCSGGSDATIRLTPPANGIKLDNAGRLVSSIDVGNGVGRPKEIRLREGHSTNVDITVTTKGDNVEEGNYEGNGVIVLTML
ncbi:hypothetical protein [Escherichia coli]|uniref:hypothetical protein n=1 Tax=Escherichia coli TaxID=562 RepID=UPI0013029BAC|nr:hypothetical protein [Escherichia coli]KAE9666522.1 hypothetical protein GP722_21340 [Escherichia coli]